MNKNIMQQTHKTLTTLAGNIRKSILLASDSFNVELISPPEVNSTGITDTKCSVYVTSYNIDKTVIDTIRKAIEDVDKHPKIYISVTNIAMVGDKDGDNGYRIDVTVEMRYILYLNDLKYEIMKVSKEYKILQYLMNKLSHLDSIESITIDDKYNDYMNYMNVDIGCGISKTALLFNLCSFKPDNKFDIDEVRTICSNVLGNSYVGLFETSKLYGGTSIRNTMSNQLRYILLANWSEYDGYISANDLVVAEMSIALNELSYVTTSKISLVSDLTELSVYHVSLELMLLQPTDVIHNTISDVTDIIVNTLDADIDKIRIVPVEVSVARSIIVHMNIYIDK